MILMTGGLGFLGLNTARAFLEQGESCVLTRGLAAREVEWLGDELGRRAFVEPLDLADRDALLELGRRYRVTGIVHLPGDGVGARRLRAAVAGLQNVLEAAREWGVPRVCVASSGDIYRGVLDVPCREDAPLPLVGTHPIPTATRSFELLSTLVASDAGFELVLPRLSALWGPFGAADSPSFALPRLVHAAVRGVRPGAVYAENGHDVLYVRDAGRAIASLQTAERLHHSIYNVGSGRVTTNAEVASAIEEALPGASIDVLDGCDPDEPCEDAFLDTSRLSEDAGWSPSFSLDSAVADYVGWLRGGDVTELA